MSKPVLPMLAIVVIGCHLVTKVNPAGYVTLPIQAAAVLAATLAVVVAASVALAAAGVPAAFAAPEHKEEAEEFGPTPGSVAIILLRFGFDRHFADAVAALVRPEDPRPCLRVEEAVLEAG